MPHYQQPIYNIKTKRAVSLTALSLWGWRWGSNPRPTVYETGALPTELLQQMIWNCNTFYFC